MLNCTIYSSIDNFHTFFKTTKKKSNHKITTIKKKECPVDHNWSAKIWLFAVIWFQCAWNPLQRCIYLNAFFFPNEQLNLIIQHYIREHRIGTLKIYFSKWVPFYFYFFLLLVNLASDSSLTVFHHAGKHGNGADHSTRHSLKGCMEKQYKREQIRTQESLKYQNKWRKH